MDFRITQQQAMDASIRHAQLRRSQIADLQDQLATGLRVRKASDDPTIWGSLSGAKASVQRMETDLDNIATVRQRLNQSVSNLTEAGNILVRARELGLAGQQTQNHETLAQELDRLIESMLSIANSSDGGRYLYSGTSSHVKPFEVVSVDDQGRPLEVQYAGSQDVTEAVVGPNSTAIMLPTGADVFLQDDRAADQYIGSTGAVAGQGTSNASGTGELTVRHTSTTYGAGNVAAGASSVGGDTIVGATGTHVLTVADDAVLGRVVSLNNGAAYPFSAASTDLQVVGPTGEQVYVDMSSVPPAFSGSVPVTANGTLSIDGGGSEVAINFTDNQLVTHADTGRVTVVDSTNIRQAGVDRIEYNGTHSVFSSLMQLRDDLRDHERWSTDEYVAIMDARLTDVERAHDQLLEFVGEQAAELSNLESLEARTRELQLVSREMAIEMENADVADVIVRLQTEQNHLQFIYATTASLSQASLLDFLR